MINDHFRTTPPALVSHLIQSPTTISPGNTAGHARGAQNQRLESGFDRELRGLKYPDLGVRK
jgi:hypothetical protein